MTAPVEQLSPPKPRRRVRRTTVLIWGCLIVPFAISVVFNGWGSLTEESALRMAFATVAGQTITILSAMSVVVLTVLMKRWRQVPFFVVASAYIVLLAWGQMSGAGEDLLERLELIAEVDRRLNQ